MEINSPFKSLMTDIYHNQSTKSSYFQHSIFFSQPIIQFNKIMLQNEENNKNLTGILPNVSTWYNISFTLSMYNNINQGMAQVPVIHGKQGEKL